MKKMLNWGLLRKSTQVVLGIALTYAGLRHLTTSRLEFQAQVPTFLSDQADLVVLVSGVVEILLGLALVVLWRFRVQIGWVTAFFFIAVFPGNIAQFVNGIDAFGLDSDQARFTRLFFQPLLVLWALWSTGAWQNFRARRKNALSR
ncbi:MAG: hypothetical protein H7227_06560 [Actinobacteria bacterium]|nr:hypothetical protein [Actinomycetota bacterium]